MSTTVWPLRTEEWVRDHSTALIEVQSTQGGNEVVVVSLDLLREMLSDLGYSAKEADQ